MKNRMKSIRWFNPFVLVIVFALSSFLSAIGLPAGRAHAASAFTTIEAESYSSMQGIINHTTMIGSLDNNDWVKYSSVDFGGGASSFTANIAVDSPYAGQKIELRLDSVTGTLIGTLTVQNTGGWDNFTTQSTSVTAGATGIHDLFLVFKGANGLVEGVGNLDWFMFAASSQPAVFNQTAPASGVTGVSVNPTFTWGASTGATNYALVVSTNSSYTSPIINVGSLTGTSYTSGTALANSTLYYWKVTATNTVGTRTATNAGISFTTGTSSGSGPGTSAFLTTQAESYSAMQGITNNGTMIGNLDNNDWTKYSSLDFGSGATGFSASIAVDPAYAGQKIEVRLDGTAGTLIGTLTVQSTGGWGTFTTQSTSVTNAVGVHDVYLVYKGANGLVEGVGNLDWFRFTINSAPSAFSQTAPAAATTNVSINSTFTWGGSFGASSYALVVATNSSFTSPIINVANLTSNSYSAGSALSYSTTYYWKVTASNANGSTVASNESISFTTIAAPPSTTYYVSPTGNDTTGDGTSTKPWKTLAYAATQVAAGIGNTISLSAGTFVETKPAVIPLGVNVQGAGESLTILSSSGVQLPAGIDPNHPDYPLWYDGSLIQLVSPHFSIFRDPKSTPIPPANGNQTLSGFTIDGNNKTLKAGVWVENRNNVTMHHVTIKNAAQRGAVFATGDKDWYIYPAYYMTGTVIHDCTFMNSGKDLPTYTSGNLNIGSLDGADIYNITINDNQGYGIKFMFDGYLKNVKIHDATISVDENDALWGEDISIELWNLGPGNEIYNVNANTWFSIVNHPDIFGNPTGTENMKIHNVKIIDKDGTSGKETIEIAAPGVEVYDSYFQDKGFGMAIWDMGRKNITIRNNVFYNTKEQSNWAGAGAVYIDNSREWAFDNIQIYNNIFDTYKNAVKVVGSQISNIYVKNNAFLNVSGNDMEANGTNIVLTNNLKYNSNSKPWVISGVTIQANNMTGNPGYLNTGNRWDTYYKPSSAASFSVDKGVNVGLSYNGVAPDVGRWEY